MDVTFFVALSIFIVFVALVLISAINYFTTTPESATIIELREKTKGLFDVFFGTGGIVTSERLAIDLYRVPLLLEENNGTARTNDVVSVSTEFNYDCDPDTNTAWNTTVRVYDQQFTELPSMLSYQEFCSSQYLNTSLVTFFVNISANEEKRVYVYWLNNTNTTPALHNLTIVGYWKFNDGSGTLAKDSSGYGNNGTLRNGTAACANGDCPRWVTGIYGNAIIFDGINDHVNISDSNITNVTDPFTLSAWIRRNQTGADNSIIDHRDGSSNGYGMRITDTDQLRCFVNADTGTLSVASTSTIGAGGWTHVTCNYNAGNMSVYINGSYDRSDTLSSDATRGGGITRIGVSSSDTRYMNGTIDEIRIYNRALSASQISQLALISNQPLAVTTFPAGTITAISAQKVQDLSERDYAELRAIFGGDFDFRIEISET